MAKQVAARGEALEIDRQYLRSDHGEKRLTISVTFAADTEKLYHRDLRVAAAYMLDIAERYEGASLEEHWTGYEDMYLRFVFFREETDTEYADRLETEKERAAQRAAEKAREKARKNIDKAIEGLQRQRASL